MPSEQGSDHAGFSSAGSSDDGDVFAGLYVEIDFVQNSVAGDGDAEVLEFNRDGAGEQGGCSVDLGCFLFDGAEGFQQPEGDVAVGRILPGDDGHFLSESR